MEFLRFLPLILAGAALLLGVIFYARNRARLRRGQTAVGKIIGWHAFHRSNGNHYIPEVQFSTPDGRTITFKSRYTAVVQPVKNSTVNILYDADDPARAELKDNLSSQHAPLVCFICAAVFGLGGIYAWLR